MSPVSRGTRLRGAIRRAQEGRSGDRRAGDDTGSRTRAVRRAVGTAVRGALDDGIPAYDVGTLVGEGLGGLHGDTADGPEQVAAGVDELVRVVDAREAGTDEAVAGVIAQLSEDGAEAASTAESAALESVRAGGRVRGDRPATTVAPGRRPTTDGHSRATSDADDESRDETSWRDYLPLVAVVGVAAAAAGALQAGGAVASGAGWMHDFMGLFLVTFALLKLVDLCGFADSFAEYDLLAARSRAWGLAYPFVELGLGLALLSRAALPATYAVTIVVMLFGAAGVLTALARGKDLRCACMGSVLDVPLSTVTLVEDVGMAAMAIAMWTFGGAGI